MIASTLSPVLYFLSYGYIIFKFEFMSFNIIQESWHDYLSRISYQFFISVLAHRGPGFNRHFDIFSIFRLTTMAVQLHVHKL